METLVPYETRLDRNPRWALLEGSMHFEKHSSVFRAMQAITKRLVDLGVSHAVVDGMAMFLHGYRRFTEDVDILVNADGLRRLHAELEGRGYLPLFEGSKNLRDTDTGVRIEFLVTGGFPGDGQPKAVSFPDPDQVGIEIEGIRCLGLETLVQLKLASGTAPGRRRDLADVQDLIRDLRLPEDFADRLDPSVRPMYLTLWSELQQSAPE